MPTSTNSARSIDHVALLADLRRPPFVPAGSYGYSGNGQYAERRRLYRECNGDRHEFMRRLLESYVGKQDLTQAAKEEIAESVALRLLRTATGRVASPLMWKRAARRAGVRVEEFADDARGAGYCIPALLVEPGAIGGTVYINTAKPRDVQTAAWVHELAHLILHEMMPEVRERFQYDDDSDSLAHEIARMVEEIVMDQE